MTTVPAIKSVTKTVLSGFIREHSSLNLTQAKALTDQLLGIYIVTVKPPPDPNAPVEPGQLWLHTASRRVLRVTGVELGPVYVPGNPVTSWGTQRVLWQDDADSAASGSTDIQLWRENTRKLSVADATIQPEDRPTTSPPTTTPESEIAP